MGWFKKCVCLKKNKKNVQKSPLSDLVELLWVINNNLYTHLHFGLLQAEVQASDLGINDTLHHTCDTIYHFKNPKDNKN